eukprot:gene41238-44613_t
MRVLHRILGKLMDDVEQARRTIRAVAHSSGAIATLTAMPTSPPPRHAPPAAPAAS